MPKIVRGALLALLVSLLAASASMAGPSGPKNGDPDSPQMMLPMDTGHDASGRGLGARGTPVADSHRRISDAWTTVLRVYLRLNGVRVG
jgi:hypothetical protein